VSWNTDWRSKHVSSVGTENDDGWMGVGRNCGIQDDEDKDTNFETSDVDEDDDEEED